MAKKQAPAGEAIPAAATRPAEIPAGEAAKHPCPICAGELKGAGRETSRAGKTRYFRCTTCGHTWSERAAMPGIVEIAYRKVELVERDAPQI